MAFAVFLLPRDHHEKSFDPPSEIGYPLTQNPTSCETACLIVLGKLWIVSSFGKPHPEQKGDRDGFGF